MCVCVAFAPVLLFFIFGPVMSAASGWKGLLRALGMQCLLVVVIALLGFPTTVDLLRNWRDNGPEIFLLLAVMIFPALLGTVVVYARQLEERQPKAEICRGCGYDLRASPERCPECGLPVKPEAPVERI